MPKTSAPAPVVLDDEMTVGTPIAPVKEEPPMVNVFIPPAPEADAGIKVDPYEHVTINGGEPIKVLRGVHVKVPVPVFLQLRNKYPNL